MKKCFALYHDDTFIDLGSRKHLASVIGVSANTIKFYQSPTYYKRTNGRGYVVIEIDDSEDD